jgi:hypothetical protein
MQHRDVKRCAVASFLPLALALACSDGEVDLGDGLISQNVTQSGRCADSPRLEGEIYVQSQAELDELSGCERIGGLRIVPFEGIDLTALASLRRIDGPLDIGADPQVFPEDPEEQTEFLAPIRALQEGGWVDSLHGLENLESVQAFYLTGVGVSDLSELESLETVDGLVIRYAHNLQSLNGLGASPRLLWITFADALHSLDGVELETNGASLILEWVPALVNIDAIAQVASLDGLILSGTGLTAFPQLDQLAYVTAVSIGANEALTDLSGLGALQGVVALTIAGNPSLTVLPQFPQLSSFEDFIVIGNSALTQVSLNFPSLQPLARTIGERELQLNSGGYIEISYNDNLQHITSPANTVSADAVSIFQNPSLLDLDLGELTHADVLLIDDNAVLGAVSAPSLATVDHLEVIDNPALSTAVFDAIDTFNRQISGNAD